MLGETDNFCAQCGQENTTKVVSFGTLVYEVVSDFVSWDSRWFQTVVPFLFLPGRLTNEFIAGKRVRYMPPLRLYFFVSLICFSIIAYYTAWENKADDRKEQAQKQMQTDSIRNAVLKSLPSDIPAGKREQIEKALKKLALEDQIKGLINSRDMQDEEEEDKVQNSMDSVGKTPVLKNPKRKSALTDTVSVGKRADKDDEMDGKVNEWTLLTRMADNPALSEKEILDSLRWEDTYWNRLKVNRTLRLKNGKKEEFLAEMWDKAPVFMFILLPFMALIMKLLYIRRKRLYIEHLIFMLHIHAFAFFVIALDIVLSNEFANLNPSGVLIPLILLYMWIAFYKVYRQGWFRTSFKLFSFLFLYSFIFATVAVFAVIFAAATY
jgi:hypothetical protein